MSKPVQVFIGLGSNLNQPVEQLNSAVAALLDSADLNGVSCSNFYSGKPMGPQDQPDYVNAVVQLETHLKPRPLLQLLQRIEEQQGRVRERRWGERIIDLDLLLYGDQCIDLPELTVPHIGLAERNFVLYPLQEMVPDLYIPQLGALAQLISACPQADLQKIKQM